MPHLHSPVNLLIVAVFFILCLLSLEAGFRTGRRVHCNLPEAARSHITNLAVGEHLLSRINGDSAAADRIQTQIWSQATAIAKDAPQPVNSQIIVDYVSNMIETRGRRIFAQEDTVPPSILDLDRPGEGFARISQSSLLDVQNRINTGR